jgi:3-oxoacyl-[acyl-carrier protein] reductase
MSDIISDDRKVILITGTSKGIGRYLAEYYVERGFYVIGCSRSNIDFSNKLYKHFEIDITDEKNIVEIFNFIRKEIKRLDILINNAVSNPNIVSSALLSYTDIEKAYKTNVFSTMIFCRESIKIMMRKKFGRIVNIGSMVTKHESLGGILYSPTKAAINSYTKVLSKEINRVGITVNVVAPSAIKTKLSDGIDKLALADILSRNAITDFGKMSDISNLIDLLIKNESDALTGQVFYLGGA